MLKNEEWTGVYIVGDEISIFKLLRSSGGSLNSVQMCFIGSHHSFSVLLSVARGFPVF